MNCLDFFDSHIDHVFATHAALADDEGIRAVDRARAAGKSVEEIPDRNSVPAPQRNRRTIVLDTHRGQPFGSCPGSKRHQCCNYRTVDLYLGCSIGCSYCIMNGYLNYAPMVVQVDVSTVISRIRDEALSMQGPLRVGSGEVGDSLLLDPVFRLNEHIIRGVADLPDVSYETKTKTDYVDHLVSIEPKGSAVISFSLNPSHVADQEEGLAAHPQSRLYAALRCVEAGFHTAFHFDPVIQTDSFPDDYLAIIHDLARFPAGSIRWVSLGTLRFPPALRDSLRDRPYSAAEFVPSADGKLRYLQPVRREMYQILWRALKSTIDAPVYLCMESEAMWRYLTGSVPQDIPSLSGIFDSVQRSGHHAAHSDG